MIKYCPDCVPWNEKKYLDTKIEKKNENSLSNTKQEK